MATQGIEDWREWAVPGVFPLTSLEIAADHGIAAEALLREAAIEVSGDDILSSGLPMAKHLRLMEAVVRAVDDPGFGFEVGWRLPPTALGSLGLALLASSTLAEALELLQRYWHLIARPFELAVDVDGEVGVLDLSLRLPALEPHRGMFFESALVSIYRGVCALAPEAAPESEIWFDFPEPPHLPRVKEHVPIVRYAMPANQFRMPAHHLEARLPMANPLALRAAVEQCERQQAERGLAGSPLVMRIQRELKEGASGYPDLEQMARRLHMTSRTLRRRLRREGTRYSSLVEGARRRQALRLLGNPDLDVRQVAEMVGYDDPANFTRAFRRWTGQTPSQYRQSLRAPRG